MSQPGPDRPDQPENGGAPDPGPSFEAPDSTAWSTHPDPYGQRPATPGPDSYPAPAHDPYRIPAPGSGGTGWSGDSPGGPAGQLPPGWQPGMPVTPQPPARELPENVGRGLLLALGGVVGGFVLTLLVWKLGFIASITTFALAAGAAWLYPRGSGGGLRKGVVPLAVLIIVGVIASILGCIGLDASDYFTQNQAQLGGYTRWGFIASAITDPDVLKGYGGEIAMMVLFAALGAFSVLRQILGAPRRTDQAL